MDHKKSDDVRSFLENKLADCKLKIKKMKRKRKIVKIIYASTIIVSISVSTLTATVAGVLPLVVISILSTVGAISTAISTQFNLRDKRYELDDMISRLERLKQKIDYVITCNGDLTEEESNVILKEFL